MRYLKSRAHARFFRDSPKRPKTEGLDGGERGIWTSSTPHLTAFKPAEKNRDRTLSSPVPVLEILSYFLLLAFRARAAEP
jgi:hypothetical protein